MSRATNDSAARTSPADRTGVPGGQILSEFVAAVVGGVVVVDEEGVVALCNPAAQELFGRPAEDLVGGRFGFPLVANETAHLDLRTSGGISRPIEMRVTETAWGAGRAYIVALRDLQAEVEAAKELEASEERFRKVFDESPIGLAIVDADLRFERVNLSLAAMLGYSDDELGALSLRDVAVPEDLETDATTVSNLLIGASRAYKTEKRYLTKRGGVVWVQVTMSLLNPSSVQERSAIVIVEDITDRREDQTRLAYQALHDDLTGVANRVLAMDHVHLAQARAERSGQFLALMFVDLDGFKSVNDTFGHEAGDAVLIEAAQRLRAVLRPSDTLARLGGDEFLVCCEDMGGDEEDAQAAAVAVAERILETLARPVACVEGIVHVTASVGIAFSRRADLAPEVLLRHADAAMYRSKGHGTGGYRLYDEAHRSRVNERVAITSGLRLALERHELVLHYQPIVRLDGGGLVGAEALVRWRDPRRGLLLPAEFLDVAERTGLIVPIGEWVLREACHCLRRWLETSDDPLLVSVNASARQLGRGELVESVMSVLAETGIPAGSLHIELTEWMFIEANAATLTELEALHRLGVQLGLDDFGTGYASLTYLQRLPVEFMKIDRSFVVGINESTADRAIIAAVIGLGNALGLTVIAEGVETEEQGRALQAMGCEYGQGWHLGYPQPEARISELLLAGA